MDARKEGRKGRKDAREEERKEGKEKGRKGILLARNTYCRVDMANLSSPAYVEFIFVLLFRCFPVHWVVKVHAFGVLPLPVSPDQVATHAQKGYYRWRKGQVTLDLPRAPAIAQRSVHLWPPL